jgi:hypothetical protein
MKTKEVIEFYGSVREAANALNISTAAIYLWKDEVPKSRQAHVEAATRGKIKMRKRA